ncbi:hypothetical protein QVD17_10238 [Tagetes erecta]|uniref:Secreted protein n=1 Tax=Tagetes erecta TaxID=13708 RepID=A0AAD8L5C9_TARER|nr:hypothetical protein QVD17_10238 [Tagetes erecta]
MTHLTLGFFLFLVDHKGCANLIQKLVLHAKEHYLRSESKHVSRSKKAMQMLTFTWSSPPPPSSQIPPATAIHLHLYFP